ncbi:ATP-dependent RNA helicase DDX39A [Plecturocebus cupreus]
MPSVKVSLFFGGLFIKKHEELVKNCPHVMVGTLGRTMALVQNRILDLKNAKCFVLDACDKMLRQQKQGILIGATLSKETRAEHRGSMQDPMEVLVDETEHTLHAPQQYYLKLKDAEKN